jgi:hypothetical protein
VKISKNSWHYRAFAWSYTWDYNHVPENSNLCSYVRRLVIGVPFNAICFGAVALLFGFISLFMLPFGYYLRDPWHRLGLVRDEVGRFNGLKIGKRELMPWHALLPLLLMLVGYANYRVIKNHDYFNCWFIVECALLATAAIVAAIIWYDRSDVAGLARTYLDAKTQGICPLITFKDE